MEREKNVKLIREVKEAKEETAQIRTNTQQIISTYQVTYIGLTGFFSGAKDKLFSVSS